MINTVFLRLTDKYQNSRRINFCKNIMYRTIPRYFFTQIFTIAKDDSE
jgi:hypothetical protein